MKYSRNPQYRMAIDSLSDYVWTPFDFTDREWYMCPEDDGYYKDSNNTRGCLTEVRTDGVYTIANMYYGYEMVASHQVVLLNSKRVDAETYAAKYE